MYLIKRLWNELRWAILYGESRTKFFYAVLSGEYIIETPFLSTSMGNNPLNAQLKATDNNLRRIQMIQPHFDEDDFRELSKSVDGLLPKDDVVAGMFINKGEEYFDAKNYKLALRCFNLGSLFAVSQNHVGNIHRKRSAVLFQIEDYDGCLYDTLKGLQINCPRSMVQDLNIRRMKCEVLRKSRKPEKPGSAEKKKYRDKTLFQLHKGRNDKIVGASSSIEIKIDEKGSRGLFVKEDVPPGSTIIIEDPYVKNVNGSLCWDIKHCWCCLKIIQCVIPCPKCVFAVYCTEECREEDAKLGHVYECACLPYFHGSIIKSNVHLAYKALYKAGPKELYKMYSTSSLQAITKTRGIHPETGVFDSRTYTATLNQASHIKYDDHLPDLVWVALSVIEIMDIKTDFFAGIRKADKRSFKNFVAAVALHHNLSVPFNCLALTEALTETTTREVSIGDVALHSPGSDTQVITRAYIPYVGGVYPLMSLMNHSCDPTVGHVHLPNGKIAMMTLKALKAGDEAFYTYGVEFGSHGYSSRQKCLSHVYQFRCRCLACKFNWPIDRVLSDRRTVFRCPFCTDGFNYYDFDKCTLKEGKDGWGTCPTCSDRFDLQMIYEEVQSRVTIILDVEQLLLKNKPKEAIDTLLEYIKYLQRKVSLPSYELVAADRTLTKAYYLVMEN